MPHDVTKKINRYLKKIPWRPSKARLEAGKNFLCCSEIINDYLLSSLSQPRLTPNLDTNRRLCIRIRNSLRRFTLPGVPQLYVASRCWEWGYSGRKITSCRQVPWTRPGLGLLTEIITTSVPFYFQKYSRLGNK